MDKNGNHITKTDIKKVIVGLRAVCQSLKYNLDLGNVDKCVELSDEVSKLGNAVDVLTMRWKYGE